MDDLQKEMIKYNLLNKPTERQPASIIEILALLIFAFMVMMYFNQQQQNKQSSTQTPPYQIFMNRQTDDRYLNNQHSAPENTHFRPVPNWFNVN